MAEIRSIQVVQEIPIKSKYEPIIRAVQKNIRQLESGKILEVELERANESTNLEDSLEKHIGGTFKVSVRTGENIIKGYVQLLQE